MAETKDETLPAGEKKSTKAPKGAKKVPKGAKKSPKAPPGPEEEPVLSGRMVIALALALALIVIPTSNLRKFITKTAPTTTSRAQWKVGERATLHLTVVTSDYEALACAGPRSVNGTHCEWESEKNRWPQGTDDVVDDNKLHVLQPYRTTDSNLLLAAGLWAQPEVAMRVHTEPARGVSKSKLARFVVSCEVEFLEEWNQAIVRWSPGEKWSDQGKAMVGKIHGCTILEDQKS